MTSKRQCFVYIVLPGETDFVTAARFEWQPADDTPPIGRFVYGKSYLARPDAVEFDPIELRLVSTSFETARLGGFFGAIRDSMPDYWGRRVIERNAQQSTLDEFDYLLLGADDRAGALGFGSNVDPPPPRTKFSRTLELQQLQSAADAIVDNESDRIGSEGRQVEELLLEGTSMGGARPKAVIEDSGALWIAKFGQREDRWNHACAEHACMRLAERAGLSVAQTRVEKVADRDVLLVRRFDRDLDLATKKYHRHRMASALTLLRSHEAVTDRRLWSYLLLADELRRVSSAPREDLRELYRRICFNAAISNLDDHPRNHAILATSGSWRLSPAYDLTPTPSVSNDRRDLAMICGPGGRFANRANIVKGATQFLLDEKEAATIFDSILDTVRANWRSALRREGASEAQCDLLERAFGYDGLLANASE